MFLMWTGNEFQAAGPATVNELSANRVLVRRTTKLPRVDDRRRWSLIGQILRRRAMEDVEHQDG